MGQKLSDELNELASHLWWLGKHHESTLVKDIASKCAFYNIEESKQLGEAMSHYADFSRANGAQG